VAAGLGCRAHVEVKNGNPAVINDAGVAELARRAAARVVGADKVVLPEPTMGGEDMALYFERVPGCFVFVGSANPAKGKAEPHHSPRFDFDEDALAIAASSWCRPRRRPSGVDGRRPAQEGPPHHHAPDRRRRPGEHAAVGRRPRPDARVRGHAGHGHRPGPEGDLLDRARRTTRLVIVDELGRAISPWADFVAFVKLYRLIRRGRYEIVHTHSSKAGVLGRIAAWLAGTPIIVHTLHSLVFHDYQPRWLNRTWWAIKKLCAPITDHYISVSRIIAERAIAEASLRPPASRPSTAAWSSTGS
jgi:hypothetical protein